MEADPFLQVVPVAPALFGVALVGVLQVAPVAAIPVAVQLMFNG